MSEKGLALHKDHGVNAHLTYCPRCRGDGSELLLVGASNTLWKCGTCATEILGTQHRRSCPKCHSRDTHVLRELESWDRLPGSLCAACEKEDAEHAEIVKSGGVYFQCTDCHAHGVVRAESPYAQVVRKAHGIEAPDPCGVEFTKEDCPNCREEENADAAE